MRVAIIMGSTSDLPKMEAAVEILKSYGVAVDVCDEMSKILGVKLHENEIGYLAMHIQRCMEEIESEIQEED